MPPHYEPSYPWYAELNSDELQQGDVLLGCPVLHPPPGFGVSSSAERVQNLIVKNQNVIILTQSCDLQMQNGRCKSEHAVVGQLYFQQETPWGKAKWNQAKRGNMPAYHVLNRCDLARVHFAYSLVDLSKIYSIPATMLLQFVMSCGPRARLLPPYREHLAQAFARFFMRVGLPIDIPDF